MKELRQNRPTIFCEEPPFPQNMLMELTNACNHECAFCGYRKMRRPKGKCNKEIFFDIMKQAYDNGTREIGFYMVGEPLLCIDIEDYIKRASDLGFTYIYLTTNGALANIERMKVLLKSGLNSVKFSVNGATRETYATIHGKDNYDIVKKNIHELCSYIKKSGLNVPVFISFIENEINKLDVPVLMEEFQNIVDNIYILPCGNFGGGMTDLVERGLVKKDIFNTHAVMPCSRLFNCIHITYEGYLDACCADLNNDLAVEDLHTISLKEAWNSERMVELRKQHLSGHLSNNMCYQCIHNESIKVSPINSRLAY